MNIYKLNDGGVITAIDSVDFVSKLRESSKFDNEVSDEEYMKKFAERFKDQTSIIIRINSPELFVQDLNKAGFIL